MKNILRERNRAHAKRCQSIELSSEGVGTEIEQLIGLCNAQVQGLVLVFPHFARTVTFVELVRIRNPSHPEREQERHVEQLKRNNYLLKGSTA